MSENSQPKLKDTINLPEVASGGERKSFWGKRFNTIIVLLVGFVVAYLFFNLFLMQIVLNWRHYTPTTGKDLILALGFVIPFIVFPALIISLLFNKISGLSKKTDSKYVKYRVLVILVVIVIIFLLWPK